MKKYHCYGCEDPIVATTHVESEDGQETKDDDLS